MASKPLPSWDLTDLYSGIDDPRLESDLSRAHKRAQAFEKENRKKITKSIAPRTLVGIFKDYEAVMARGVRPAIYAYLVFAADTSSPRHGALMQRCQSLYTEIAKELMFLELELAKLPLSKLNGLKGSGELAGYRNYLQKIIASKPHQLSEPEERILADKSLTGRSAWNRFFDSELAAKIFKVKINGRTKEMSETEVLDLLHSPKRGIRKAAAASLTQGLNEESRRLTFITNTLAHDKAISDGYRKYESPESPRHLANEISKDAVDAMVEAVTESYSIVQDFYRFKRQVLKYEKLYDYDRYAPIGSTQGKIPYSKAEKIVRETFRGFSPKYGQLVDEFFDKDWIDVPPRQGKRGGAFCMYVTPKDHPYVMMNYTGGIREVMTLAHELGHGVHGMLARKQTALNYDWPLTLSETASVFSEMLTFRKLLNELPSDKARFGLYMHKIENVFATVYRQTAMHGFEQDLHAAYRNEGELSTERISELWMGRQKEMFGRSVELTPGYGIWWSYIPHFLHSPFYVYAYAFGELLTLSLYAKYEEEGEKFVPKYLDFLSAGGSRSPKELLRPLGVDLESKAFWQGGIDIIRSMVKEAKYLHKKSR